MRRGRASGVRRCGEGASARAPKNTFHVQRNDVGRNHWASLLLEPRGNRRALEPTIAAKRTGLPGHGLRLESQAMDDAKLVDRVMKQIRRSLPRHVADLRYMLFVDHSGEDAIRMWVVLKEGTPEKNWEYERTKALRKRIEEMLERKGITRYPIILLRSESEQAEVDEWERKRWAAWDASRK